MATYSPVTETKYEGISRTIVLGLSALLLLLGAAVAIAQCALLDLDHHGPGVEGGWAFFVPQMMTIGTNVLIALVGVAGIFSAFNTSRGKVKLFAGLAIAVTVIVILVMLITLAVYFLVVLADKSLDGVRGLLAATQDEVNPDTNKDSGYKSWVNAIAMFKATLIIYGLQIVLLIVSAVMGHKAMGACCFKSRTQRA